MPERNVAIVIFYDDKENIIIQKRGEGVSKTGEKYGFFGGGIEKGETPEMTIRRELKEEMGFVPGNLIFWGVYSYRVRAIDKRFEDKNGWMVKCWIFLAPITVLIKKAKITEGEGILLMKIDEVIDGDGFPIGATKFMKKLKKELYGRED